MCGPLKQSPGIRPVNSAMAYHYVFAAGFVYSCFEKGCPTKANKRTRQCRKVLWVIVV